MRTTSSFSPIPARVENAKDPFFWATLILAALLLFWALDGRSLWQDEAETALLAKHILRFGLPIAYDGTNVVSQEAGQEFGPDFLWRWSPWVQFYIAAASINLLGPTTLAARLPFALLGFLTIPLLYILSHRLFGSRRVARLSALFLTLSVPFLLHARQARWYPPAYLLLVCLFLALARMGQGKRFASAGFVASGVLLFYTNYFIAIGVLLSLGVAAPLLQRDWPFLQRLLKASGLLVILLVPGIGFFEVLHKGGALVLGRVVTQLWAYLGSYLTFLMPAPMLLPLGYLLTQKNREPWVNDDRKRPALFLFVFSVVYLIYLALAPWMSFRYLSILLPPAVILLTLSTSWLLQLSRWAGAVVVMTLLFTNVLHLYPLGMLQTRGTASADNFPAIGPFSFPLVGYLYELSHKLEGPEYVLSRYLQERGRPQDVVLITYGDLPLQFYTGLRVVGGLQGRPLPANPDWIILRHFLMSNQAGKDGDVFRFVEAQIDLSLYRSVELPCGDFRIETNPDPQFHLFKAPPEVPLLRLLRRTGR
jgi:4-amino-4-deoxy-L-arabinose transferase-like glycosyltransferase